MQKDTGEVVLCLGLIFTSNGAPLVPYDPKLSAHIQEGPECNFSLTPPHPNDCWLLFVNKRTATHLKYMNTGFFYTLLLKK